MTAAPEQHYRAADRILTEVDEVGTECLNLPYVRAKIALANAHALLAQCPPEYSGYNGYQWRGIHDVDTTGDRL